MPHKPPSPITVQSAQGGSSSATLQCLGGRPVPCRTCNSISGLCLLDAVTAPHLCLCLWAKPSVLGVGGRSPVVELHWLEETPDAQAVWTSPCPSTTPDPGASEGSIQADRRVCHAVHKTLTWTTESGSSSQGSVCVM